MAYRKSELGLIVQLDPDRAAMMITGAMRRAGGRIPECAAVLGIGPNSLYRYIEKLGLVTTTLKIRALHPKARKPYTRRVAA